MFDMSFQNQILLVLRWFLIKHQIYFAKQKIFPSQCNLSALEEFISEKGLNAGIAQF